jgi:prephenate dehydrogenase
MRVAFLGLGLIGGSIARATRAAGHTFVAWTPDGDGPRAALAAGTIDEIATTREGAVDGSDLVVLAAPPLACLDLIAWLGGDGRTHLASGATVTDVASSKRAIVQAALRAEIPFVGGHPMAGREATGFAAADGALFRDRPWIITEAVHGGDPTVVERLAVDAGAIVIFMDSRDHDRAVAAISHLPLIASVALVEAVVGVEGAPSPADAAAALRLAAGGWQGMTRLAKGDPAMAAGIAITNRDALVSQLLAYRDRLEDWLALLDVPGEPDAAELERRFTAARTRATGEPG